MKLGKFATKTLEMICEDFGEHSLSWTAVFEWHSHFKLKTTKVQGDQAPAKQQKMLKKYENSSMKTVAKQSMSS
jgi:hypothetical protein